MPMLSDRKHQQVLQEIADCLRESRRLVRSSAFSVTEIHGLIDRTRSIIKDSEEQLRLSDPFAHPKSRG
jgi:hypothetical protein